MNRLIVIGILLLATFAGHASDCPREASANAVFLVVDENGRALPSATVLFTASNWDSTLVQSSDSAGRVEVLCVPAGDGYDVTVMHSGYAITHVSATASEDSKPVRIPLRRLAGRYVRVTHNGWPIPGATVMITSSGSTIQKLETDHDGFARFAELSGSGDAVFEISLAGFFTQRASIGREYKNGPLLFDLSVVPVCKPIQVEA